VVKLSSSRKRRSKERKERERKRKREGKRTSRAVADGLALQGERREVNEEREVPDMRGTKTHSITSHHFFSLLELLALSNDSSFASPPPQQHQVRLVLMRRSCQEIG